MVIVMRSDPTNLDGQTFDCVVVGGGIQGAALAREFALRSRRVLLVERDDFASGTSMRSSRLIHGGVRYLQQGHLSLVREALAEREILLRTAPHLVRPLPMLMPFYRDGGGLPPWMMRTGLRLYSWLARQSSLPGPRSYSAADCIRLFPGLRETGLRGGSLFFDGRTEDLRLTFAVLQAAAESGATLCNHLELVGDDRNGWAMLRDHIGDREIRVKAPCWINAAGPGVDSVRRKLWIDTHDLVRLSRGSHLVLPPREAETALAAFLPDGRIQFVVPHPDGTIVGTTDVDDRAVDDRQPTVPDEDRHYIEAALGRLLDPVPAAADYRFAYAGWRALPASKGPPGALNREAFTVAEETPVGTLHSVIGGKLTTHRAFAERTVNRLLDVRGASPSRHLVLPGGEAPHDTGDPLWWRHGSRAADVRTLALQERRLLEPLAAGRDFICAEAVYGMRAQGAVTFVDLALRRLFHSQGPDLDEASLRVLFELWAAERPEELANQSFEDVCAELRDEVDHMTGRPTPVESSVGGSHPSG